MVRKIIVGQGMDQRPEPVALDSLKDRLQRLPVEVNLVLRYRMWSNCPVSHFPDEDDIDQVTRALLCLQFAMKLLGDGAIRGPVVDVSVKGLVWVSHSDACPAEERQG